MSILFKPNFLSCKFEYFLYFKYFKENFGYEYSNLFFINLKSPPPINLKTYSTFSRTFNYIFYLFST